MPVVQLFASKCRKLGTGRSRGGSSWMHRNLYAYFVWSFDVVKCRCRQHLSQRFRLVRSRTQRRLFVSELDAIFPFLSTLPCAIHPPFSFPFLPLLSLLPFLVLSLHSANGLRGAPKAPMQTPGQSPDRQRILCFNRGKIAAGRMLIVADAWRHSIKIHITNVFNPFILAKVGGVLQCGGPHGPGESRGADPWTRQKTLIASHGWTPLPQIWCIHVAGVPVYFSVFADIKVVGDNNDIRYESMLSVPTPAKRNWTKTKLKRSSSTTVSLYQIIQPRPIYRKYFLRGR